MCLKHLLFEYMQIHLLFSGILLILLIMFLEFSRIGFTSQFKPSDQALMFLSELRGASKITSKKETWTSEGSDTWFLMKWTECWTWVLLMMWRLSYHLLIKQVSVDQTIYHILVSVFILVYSTVIYH